MADRNGHPTRRAPFEVNIDPAARPHIRHRLAVDAIFAPDWPSAARLLLEAVTDFTLTSDG